MSRRRWLGLGLVMLAGSVSLGVAVRWWGQPAPAPSTAPTRRVATDHRPPVDGSDISGVDSADAPTDLEFIEAFEAQVAALDSHCDLPLHSACADETCVALVVSPDLDQLQGWIRVAIERPRFVASAALRDLGIPADALPCGQAIDAFTSTSEVRAVELPDGTELWCVVQRAAGEPWTPQSQASCGALAHSAVGTDRTAFDDPDLRRLQFDRGR